MLARIRSQSTGQRIMLPGLLTGLLFALAAAPARAQEPFSIEPIVAKASAYLPAAVVNALDPQGSRLFTFVNGLKTSVCEIWWAKAVVTQDNPAGSGKLLYGNLKAG